MESSLVSFINYLQKFKRNEISNNQLENSWYELMHCKPHKKTHRRVFQSSFASHPMNKGFVHLREACSPKMKPAMTVCLKYTKEWWTKSTDTYLFPSLAITLFLSASPSNWTIPFSEKGFEIYSELVDETCPSSFVQHVVCSDQHTSMGAANGIGKNSRYAAPLFYMWGSAVRPIAHGQEYIFSSAIKSEVPIMPSSTVEGHGNAMVKYGEGKITEEELWEYTLVGLREGLGLMAPSLLCAIPKSGSVHYDENVKHPNPNAKYNFRHSEVSASQWPIDTIVSGLQKMIRRSKLKHALWMTSQLLSFALFHVEVNELWAIHSGAQGKVTNLLNRLVIIAAEDCLPDISLIVTTANKVANSKKIITDLKNAQTKDFYMERFKLICGHILPIVAILAGAPKARLVQTRMHIFGEHYEKAYKSLEIGKRKQQTINF